MGRATAQFGAIDILVNNAGIQFVAPIDEFPVDQLERDPRAQPDRIVPSIRLALPAMKARSGAESSTSPRRTRWSRARTSQRMSRPSMASPA